MIINYLLKLSFVMVIAMGLYILIRLLLLKCKNKKLVWKQEWASILLTGYLVGLASLTIIPSFSITLNGIQFAEISPLKRYNIVPFRTLINQMTNLSYYSIVNLVGNIIMFIPIGVLAPFVWKKSFNWRNAVIMGLLISIFIEVVQYFIGRSSDIDDIILNTLAIVFGVYIGKKIKKLE